MVGQWSIGYLPLKIQDPVPSDITIARSQAPKKIVDMADEIGLLPNEVGSEKLCPGHQQNFNVLICSQSD